MSKISDEPTFRNNVLQDRNYKMSGIAFLTTPVGSGGLVDIVRGECGVVAEKKYFSSLRMLRFLSRRAISVDRTFHNNVLQDRNYKMSGIAFLTTPVGCRGLVDIVRGECGVVAEKNISRP